MTVSVYSDCIISVSVWTYFAIVVSAMQFRCYHYYTTRAYDVIRECLEQNFLLRALDTVYINVHDPNGISCF